MIIECSQCHTRFRLADDKVKPGGVKVRCSKCKNVFIVTPPPPEPEEIDFGAFNMEPVAEEGWSDSAQDMPANRVSFSPEPSFPEGSERAVGSDIFGDGRPKGTPDFQKNQPEEEENPDFSFGEISAAGVKGKSDWSFGAGDLENDYKSDDEGLVNSSFSFEDDKETAGDETAGPVEYSFGDETDGTEIDDFGMEDDDSSEEEILAWNRNASPENESFGFDEEPEDAPPEEDNFDFSEMELGNSESDRDVAEDGSGLKREPAVSLEMNETRDETGGQPSAREHSSARDASFGAAAPLTRKPRSPMAGVMFFLVFLLLVLLGLASVFFWTGKPARLAEFIDQIIGSSAPTAATGQVRLADLSGFFVNNREAAQMFIIEGKSINDFSEARSAIAIKGVLYDKEGRSLLQQTVFAGNPIDRKELTSMDFAAIEEKMNNQFGESLSNLNVAPGQSLPFTIVFRDLPSGLAEFTVEAADSKPGSKQ